EVFIHNMRLQSEDRSAKLAAEKEEEKELGIVAVCVGEGNEAILKSLGVDYVVSGGQTMNPSTKDLLDAVNAVNAKKVLILPNNKNIIMASQSCVEVSEKPCAVVPTTSVPEAFAALFVLNPEASLEENVEEMTEAFSQVETGEVTHAIKDAKDSSGNPIHDGDVIGIANGSIDVVTNSVKEATFKLLEVMEADDYDTLTLLAGCDMTDEEFEEIVSEIEEKYEDLEVDPHRGEQPLYPIVLSLE
ncbi:MAG: DAK2 domain-containing protein, partial [Anaerotardibacter sp.]